MWLAYLRSEPTAHGPLDDPALTALYRHPQPAENMIMVRSNFVQSLDGSITGVDGRSGSVNTPADQQVFALHRAHADAILVGAGTARAEGYRAVDLAPWQSAVRAAEGMGGHPALVIVSRRLDVDPAVARPVRGPGGPVLVITTERAAADRGRRLREAGVEVVGLGADDVDLARLPGELADRGLRRVVCEGGPQLHRDLLAADLVDELSLTLAPRVVGGSGPRTTAGAPLDGDLRFVPELVLVADDGTVFTRYRRPG